MGLASYTALDQQKAEGKFEFDSISFERHQNKSRKETWEFTTATITTTINLVQFEWDGVPVRL